MIAVFITLAHIALAIGVSAHIILTKDDVRSAIGWVGLVWLAPVLGSVLYMALGVNRISRRAGVMRGHAPLDAEDRAQMVRAGTAQIPAVVLGPDAPEALNAIARLVGTVTRQPLTSGCAIDPLLNGDEAYPAMIAAINAATRSMGLASVHL